MRKCAGQITTAAYKIGFRPAIPAQLDFVCPDLAKLISEMWDGDASKRPSLKQVVARLQACATVDLDDGACWPLDGRTSSGEGDATQTVSGTDKDAQIEALQATIRELRASTDAQQATIRELRTTTKEQQERIQALEQATTRYS